MPYIRTDLAAESAEVCDGAYVREYEREGFNIHEAVIESDKDTLRYGRYITVTVGQLWFCEKSVLEGAERLIAELIRELAGAFVDVKTASVLTVCLGNRRITSDAVGPLAAEKLIATRHLKGENMKVFEALGGRESAVMSPGVTGETGVETFEAIFSAVEVIKPDLVICIDALAARSSERLMTTVQLTDVGIAPGSGVGNHRREISLSTLGVPVVSVGVPTVVESATLVYDALEKAGISDGGGRLSKVFENQRSFFVTPKNADVAVAAQATLIARAINTALLGIAEL